MPETTETFSLGFRLDDLGDVWESVHACGEQIVLEGPETFGKVIVLLRAQMLVAKEQNLVIKKSLVEPRETIIIKPDR